MANLFRRLSTRRDSSPSLPTTSKMADNKNNNKEMEHTKEGIVQSKQLVKNRTKNGPRNTRITTAAKRTKPQGKRNTIGDLLYLYRETKA